MNQYIEKLNHYLSEHPVVLEESTSEDILDLLWNFYSEEHSVENSQIRDQFAILAEVWNILSEQESDRMFSVTCSLCSQCQQLAFREGFKVGLHLFALE